ncbi:MAG: cytochrome c oxidase subunit II [Actinomycetota bacterium]
MRQWWRAHPGWALGVLGLALTGLGEWAVTVLARNLPLLASTEGAVVDEALVVLLRLVVPVFAFVTLALVFALTRFRAPAGEVEDAADQVDTDRRATLAWLGTTLGLATLVVIFPGVTGLRRLDRSSAAAADPLQVDVLARQWEWRFSYPAYGVRDATELVMPLGRPVRFTLRSQDVIHAFWIPSMRIKMDVIPGETRTLTLTPSTLTSTAQDPRTRVQCAELCGVGHGQMAAPARVVQEADFQGWAADQARGGAQ